ncbi:hypothetical protein B1991_14470 [Rhodanobacter lindaniclasticus]|uniref:Uncharacterized protein n=1 Tax=Rhodanobacter lindaniclasticus TaxID=75310 RepID=A0A4S3KE03_9GAMM|nr:hypothetical protein B1991_14470 [Rhodanobacter lindaniclasticus]
MPALDRIDDALIERCVSFQQALAVSRAMGRRKPNDAALANAVGVLPCVWSRIQNKPKNRPAYTPEDRYPALCDALGNVGVIQWLAAQVGMELVPKVETREQLLRRELAEIEQARAAA